MENIPLIQFEEYIVMNLKIYERSLICQLRYGILLPRIETGRTKTLCVLPARGSRDCASFYS